MHEKKIPTQTRDKTTKTHLNKWYKGVTYLAYTTNMLIDFNMDMIFQKARWLVKCHKSKSSSYRPQI